MQFKTKIKAAIKRLFNIAPQIDVRANIYYLSPNNRLKGKKIIITGGGRGLGAAMCKKFISEGAEVLIAGRNTANLKEVADNTGCQYITFDIRNTTEISNFIEHANSMLGGANCLVNNAGISLHEGSILNVSETDFESQIATNLRAGYFLTQQFIKLQKIENKAEANVLFMSSERGILVDDLPYGITKAAVNSLVQGLAYQYIQNGIRINALAPGVTTSDMTGFKEDKNLYCKYNITNRVYLSEEVAEIACFLLSDAARCINGQIIACNEGKAINYRR